MITVSTVPSKPFPHNEQHTLMSHDRLPHPQAVLVSLRCFAIITITTCLILCAFVRLLYSPVCSLPVAHYLRHKHPCTCTAHIPSRPHTTTVMSLGQFLTVGLLFVSGACAHERSAQDVVVSAPVLPKGECSTCSMLLKSPVPHTVCLYQYHVWWRFL